MYFDIFFRDGYLKLSWLGKGVREGIGNGIFYYFINVIISTLHISSFIVVYIDIWHSYSLLCFDVFPPHQQITFLATKNVSPQTGFDLGGWNRHDFVKNWIAWSPRQSHITFWIFDLLPVKTCHTNKKYAKNAIFWKNKIKQVCDTLLLTIVNQINWSILFNLWNCRRR